MVAKSPVGGQQSELWEIQARILIKQGVWVRVTLPLLPSSLIILEKPSNLSFSASPTTPDPELGGGNNSVCGSNIFWIPSIWCYKSDNGLRQVEVACVFWTSLYKC